MKKKRKLKVGDTVWFNTMINGEYVGVRPHKIDRVETIYVVGIDALVPTHIYDWELGKSVFDNKEDAEEFVANYYKNHAFKG